MIRNILIILLITSFGLVACADLVAFKKRDNKTDSSTNKPGDNSTPDNGTTADNSTKEDFFVDESKPPMNGDNVDVSPIMLRPFDPNKYKSPYNYQIVGNTILIDNGSKAYVDPSLSQTDDCSPAFYNSLTDEKFEHNNKIYLTNRKHLNEFNRIFDGKYGINSINKTYVLVKDIDLCKSANGVPAFISIGRPAGGNTQFFMSTFDGDNHIVENLYITYGDSTDMYRCVGFLCGLFAYPEGGSLQNIGVAGELNITADWTVDNGYQGVGLIGFSIGGDIKNVVSNINITGVRNVGGVVGMVTPGHSKDSIISKPATVTNVKSYGRIKGKDNVGGVVGFAKNGNNLTTDKAKNIYKGVVNWGTVTSTNGSSTTLGGLFGSYDNHDNMTPISCRNGGAPVKLYGATTIPFTCD